MATLSGDCAVCLCDLSQSGAVYATKCGHVFHWSCIHSCVESTHRCPLCNTAAQVAELRRIFVAPKPCGATTTAQLKEGAAPEPQAERPLCTKCIGRHEMKDSMLEIIMRGYNEQIDGCETCNEQTAPGSSTYM